MCTGNERLKDKNGNKLHSSQKPEKLLYKLLISATKPKDIILDPFFGTGTTGVVAKEIGRNYIGIEKEKIYIEAAEKRIASKNYQRSSLNNHFMSLWIKNRNNKSSKKHSYCKKCFNYSKFFSSSSKMFFCHQRQNCNKRNYKES